MNDQISILHAYRVTGCPPTEIRRMIRRGRIFGILDVVGPGGIVHIAGLDILRHRARVRSVNAAHRAERRRAAATQEATP